MKKLITNYKSKKNHEMEFDQSDEPGCDDDSLLKR
jgi:hypothetical protein